MTLRRFSAALSACGVAAGACAYVVSFSKVPVDELLPWCIPLMFGFVALFAPIYVLEYPTLRAASFWRRGLARGMPNWVVWCGRALWLIVLAHFVWVAVHNGPGVPAIKGGQYVLEANGRILRTVSEEEYLALKAAELRLFSTMTAAAYFVPMVYWWFKRRPAARLARP